MRELTNKEIKQVAGGWILSIPGPIPTIPNIPGPANPMPPHTGIR